VRTTLLISLVIALASQEALRAQEQPAAEQHLVPPDRHVWGRFPVGSWKLTRSAIETYDEKGNVTTSYRETRSTLKRVDAKGFVLLLEHTVEAAGRRYPQVPQEVWYGFSGETTGQKVEEARRIGDADVLINGRKIPCEVRQAAIQGDGNKRTVTIHFSPDVFPFVLRRESSAVGTADAEPATTSEEILAAGLRHRLLGELHAVSFSRTIHRQSGLTKVTMEILCDDVPGAIAAQSTQEFTSEGQVVRRTTLELTDFEIADPAPQGAAGQRQGRTDRRRFLHRKPRAEEGVPPARRKP
jgi:hypothetical protein